MIRRLAEVALSRPSAFAAYQSVVGAPDCHRRFITEHVAAADGERVLDIGCGVGASVSFIPDGVSYVGIDISAPYIEAARRTYGGRGTFVCADLQDAWRSDLGVFDKAFAFGVLHHLPDMWSHPRNYWVASCVPVASSCPCFCAAFEISQSGPKP